MASITPRNGRYLARVRLNGQTTSKTFHTGRASSLWALQIENDIARGVFVRGQQAVIPTLADALATYQRKVSAGKRGAKQERSVIGTLARLSLARRPLDSIAPLDVSRVRDGWLKGKVSPATVHRRLATLSHLYTTAIKEWNLPVENPLLRVS